MGQWIDLQVGDTPVRAWSATPPGQPRAGLIVIQEIFGANAHIRDVADRFAARGYAVLAPAFFDPVERDVELGYDAEGFAKGRELVGRLGFDKALDIVRAAAAELTRFGKVGTVGYCWGGTVALLSALRLGLPSVSYYGARNVQFLDEPLHAPVMFHFGERDESIPHEMVQQHRDKLPRSDIFTYDAGHAFNRDADPKAYSAHCAELALERTLAFFDAQLR